MEKAEWAFSILGTLLGIGGIIYGVWSDRKRVRIEAYIQGTIEGVKESLGRIHQRSVWAKSHFDSLKNIVLEITDKNQSAEALKHVVEGRSDVTCIGDAHDIIQGQLKILQTKKVNK